MPSKNEVKTYVENSYYHLYNRGVEKRIIFLDQQDSSTFLSYLKDYLLPKNEKELRARLANPNINYKEKDRILRLLRLNNFSDNLMLLAYCLMDNHFHFLVYQTLANTIQKFMNSLCARYSMYFNKKYQRVGPLFQGIYKAVIVNTEEQLLHLSRYIHIQAMSLERNPLKIPKPSSYPNYLGKISQQWIKQETILGYFQTTKNSFRGSFPYINSYQSFVEEYKEEIPEIAHLVID